ANRDLDIACPELAAVRSRIACVELCPEGAEIRALLRHLASKGWSAGQYSLRPDQTMEVAEQLIAMATDLERELDLRVLENVFQDRVMYEEGKAGADWLDLMATRLGGRTTHFRRPVEVGPLPQGPAELAELASARKGTRSKEDRGKALNAMRQAL